MDTLKERTVPREPLPHRLQPVGRLALALGPWPTGPGAGGARRHAQRHGTPLTTDSPPRAMRESLKAAGRLEELGPRRRAHLRQGPRPVPGRHGSRDRPRARGPTSGTSTATSTSSTARACGPSSSGTPIRRWWRLSAASCVGARTSPGRPAIELEAAEQFLETVPTARDGQVRQERLGRHDGGGPAGPSATPGGTSWPSAGTTRSSPPTTGSSDRPPCARASPSRSAGSP